MRFTSPYHVIQLNAALPAEPLAWEGDEGGAYIIARVEEDFVGRVWVDRNDHPAGLDSGEVARLLARQCGLGAVTERLYRDFLALLDFPPPPPPSLTCAICTRDRPTLLRRCLESVLAARDAAGVLGGRVDIIVIDNAPADDRTARIVAEHPDVRYSMEPIPGLDFARNRALAASRRQWIAYFDDDTAADTNWVSAFARSVLLYPGAGAFTGAVVAQSLNTEAKIRFEKANGFFKGTDRVRYASRRFGDQGYPCGAGRFGTGANMALNVAVLREIGGFDEALDTGPPLPAAGDLDIYYRVLRSGYLLIYDPQLLVKHEHRRDMASLRRQYFSWGLGVAAFLAKHREADREMRSRLASVWRWYLWSQIRGVGAALLKRDRPRNLILATAELCGMFVGRFGAYRRSQQRVARRRREFGA